MAVYRVVLDCLDGVELYCIGANTMAKLAPLPLAADNYPDSNSDGIPDAFANRLPISEILSRDESSADGRSKSESPSLSLNSSSDSPRTNHIEIRVPKHGEVWIVTPYSIYVIRSRRELAEFLTKLSEAGLEAFAR